MWKHVRNVILNYGRGELLNRESKKLKKSYAWRRRIRRGDGALWRVRRPGRCSLAPSYSLPGRFRTRRRVRWNGIFPANDASIFPRSKTGVLFPLISPNTTWFILWEICHPKGSIEVFFWACFMPNPAKRGTMCVFQKIKSSVFHEFDTFWRPGLFQMIESPTEKWV